MYNPYQQAESTKNYLDFLASEDGTIQQDVLYEAVISRLPKANSLKILDAACGPGWMTSRLAAVYPQTEGFDGSAKLIAHAQQHYPALTFTVADIEGALPYSPETFDVITLIMAAPDMQNLQKAFSGLHGLLKRGGLFLVTVPNPPYTSPVAEWKRNVLDVVLGRKPTLRIKKPYARVRKIEREFRPGKTIGSNFYTVQNYIETALASGFELSCFKELMSETDSTRYNLRYRLYRYPLFLLMEFKK